MCRARIAVDTSVFATPIRIHAAFKSNIWTLIKSHNRFDLFHKYLGLWVVSVFTLFKVDKNLLKAVGPIGGRAATLYGAHDFFLEKPTGLNICSDTSWPEFFQDLGRIFCGYLQWVDLTHVWKRRPFKPEKPEFIHPKSK